MNKPKPNAYTIIVDLRKGKERKVVCPELKQVGGKETIFTSRGRSIFVVAIGGDAIIRTENLKTETKTATDFLNGGSPTEIKILPDVSTGPDHSIEIDRKDGDAPPDRPMVPFPIIVDVE